jgi:hypothetical protein
MLKAALPLDLNHNAFEDLNLNLGDAVKADIIRESLKIFK